MMLEFLWLFIALSFASVTAYLAKRYGSWIGISTIASLAVVSNVLASAKIIAFPFGLHAPAGIIAYCLTFFISDLMNEFFGPKVARQGIYAGLISQIIAVPLIWLMIIWPAAPFVPASRVEAVEAVLGLSPRLFFASIVAFFVSSLLNIYIFHKIRLLTRERMIWLRSKVSTLIAILVSNLVFLPLGYLGTGLPVLNMIKGHSIVQVIIALIDTLFIYVVVYAVRIKGR